MEEQTALAQQEIVALVFSAPDAKKRGKVGAACSNRPPPSVRPTR